MTNRREASAAATVPMRVYGMTNPETENNFSVPATVVRECGPNPEAAGDTIPPPTETHASLLPRR
jgi:hypothetical protein